MYQHHDSVVDRIKRAWNSIWLCFGCCISFYLSVYYLVYRERASVQILFLLNIYSFLVCCCFFSSFNFISMPIDTRKIFIYTFHILILNPLGGLFYFQWAHFITDNKVDKLWSNNETKGTERNKTTSVEKEKWHLTK